MRVGLCGNCFREVIEKGEIPRWHHAVRGSCNSLLAVPSTDEGLSTREARGVRALRRSIELKDYVFPVAPNQPAASEVPTEPEEEVPTVTTKRATPARVKQAAKVARAPRKGRRPVAKIETVDGVTVMSIIFPRDFAGGDVSFVITAEGLKTLRGVLKEES